MIKPIDAVEIAQQLEIDSYMGMYRNFIVAFLDDANKKNIKFMVELFHDFIHQVILPFDKTYIVHRELRQSKEIYFKETLPDWTKRIEEMSVKVATVNYLWLHQVRNGAFEQYLVGFAVRMSKLLKNHHPDHAYMEHTTKAFCEILMTTIYTTLKKHAVGLDPEDMGLPMIK